MAEDQESGVELRQKDGGAVLVRIFVPELNISKILTFQREELIWNVKEQCIASLPKELKESFNYGLFLPPSNGKAGKFVEEERPLLDYPFNGPVGYFELKYKRRVYKMLKLDEKQFRSINSRSNLRRLFDYIASGQAEKINKLCAKGLDPNFHHPETGETPLTMAAVSARPRPLLLSIVGGGALLDYRTRCGSTALHRAAEKNNLEAVRTLLDLGSSPNYRDAKQLTPLYNAILAKADPQLCQALLHDYSIVGVQDTQGSHEVHQACRNGLVQQLEQLLFYGADLNARNASGNTPLHICAVNNQDACARILLFRGANREALNFANQTPNQVAVIAGNLALASLIHKFNSHDVVPFKEPPIYNPRRRKSVVSMRPSASAIALDILSTPMGPGISGIDPSCSPSTGPLTGPRGAPPSPSPSDGWLQYSMSKNTSSIRSDTGSSSSCTVESEDNTSATASLNDKYSVDQCDIVSDSSGVGTSNSGGSYDATPTDHSLVLPLMTVVCIEPYRSKENGHLQLNQGDCIEVTGSTDCGLLEGWLRNESGYFPARCVQEVRLRHHPAANQASGLNQMHSLPQGSSSRVPGRRELVSMPYGSNNTANSNFGELRSVILHRGNRGFGFVLRGAKGNSLLMNLHPAQRVPGLQYLDSVEAGSVAEKAGLRPGDFILAINGEDVSQASHEAVVDAIRRSGSLVTMTVCCAVQSAYGETLKHQDNRMCSTLPRKLDDRPPDPPKRDPRTTLSVGRTKARSMIMGLRNYEPNANKAEPEQIYSSTCGRTASIKGRSGLGLSSPGNPERSVFGTPVPPPAPPLPPNDVKAPRVFGSVAEMKRMKKNKVQEGASLHKDFHSTPDLKADNVTNPLMSSSWTGYEEVTPTSPNKDWDRSLNSKTLNERNSRHSWAFPAKTPEPLIPETRYNNSWQSIENLCRDVLSQTNEEDDEDLATPIADQLAYIGSEDPYGPPPSFPPPPPPPLPSEVVSVGIVKKSDYAVSTVIKDPPASAMSTFKPSNTPKTYADPHDGFMTLRAPPKSGHNGNPAARSLSLPLHSTRPAVKINRKEEPRVTVTVNSTPVIPDPDYDVEELRMQQDTPKTTASNSLTAEILKAKSKLKPSLSVPDMDKQNGNKDVYITRVPVNNDRKEIVRKTSILSRHAVSLVHLPPPVESKENDGDSDAERMMLDSHSHRRIVEQDSVSTASTMSSLSTSSFSSDRDSLENHRYNPPQVSWNNRRSSGSDRTIEESLQIIRKNVSSINELHRSGGMVPPPPEFTETTPSREPDSPTQFLPPPPPEFCDRLYMDRRDSDDLKSAPRIVGAVPKRVSFSPDVIECEDKIPKGFGGGFFRKSCK